MQPQSSQVQSEGRQQYLPLEATPGPEGGPDEQAQVDHLDSEVSPEDLAEMMARLAHQLHGEQGVDETLRMIVDQAVKAVSGAEAAAITEVLGRGRKVDVLHTSDEWVIALDGAQYETGQGPGLKESYAEPTVRVEDFATEQRWPTFADRARELNAGSLLSLRLYVEGEDLAVLNLYSSRVAAFDEDSEQVARVFAAHAAIALAGARSREEWRKAVGSRDIIGQAKGILMERFKITADQAFEVLVKASSESQIKVREVAEIFAGSGRGPAAGLGRTGLVGG